MNARSRPFYIADVGRKRIKGTGSFHLDNNAFHEARRIGQEKMVTVLVMREGIVIREFLPKSRGKLLVEEIERVAKRLANLRRELDVTCIECGKRTEQLYDTGLCEECQEKVDNEPEIP